MTCTSLDPDNHTILVLEESKGTNLWVGTMENETVCRHPVMARLISTSVTEAYKEKIDKLRAQSKWLDHVCEFHGTKSLSDRGTFLLMGEYKESLQTKLERDKMLTSEEIQKYGSDIICGVGQLHHAGIVCMDIGPSTILLDEKGRAHISRYGFTIEKHLCDKHNYTAPETWNGNVFSKTSDVWSVGCTLLAMCSGMFLWAGLSETEILEYVKQKILPVHLDDLEEPLFTIIHDCLCYEVEKRPTLNQIQEKFLSFRPNINPLANSLRTRELPTNANEIAYGDKGESASTDKDEGGEGYGEEDSAGEVSSDRDVLLACEKGSFEDLEKLLQQGASCGDGRALCVAVSLKQCHEKDYRPGKLIVQSLLRHGIDTSCKDDLGHSPLHIAAGMNDEELMSILIDAGADVNIRNSQNETPLHVALKNRAGLPCIGCLLQKGADHTLQDNDGNNALHIAAQVALSCKNVDAVSMILLHASTTHDFSASPLGARNYRGYSLVDILRRLPKHMISQELKEKLGADLHGNGDSPEPADLQDRKRTAVNIKNLQDAELAGGINSLDCTLIVVEGRTADKFADIGRDLVGKNIYGSYTLCGKLMNPDGKSKYNNNTQVQDIFSALGLEFGGAKYIYDKKKIRYGHIMMMLDQDSDGNHIRGLLINLINSLCPQLLQIPLFLQDFRTYLYKVTNVETKEIKSFRFLKDYRIWTIGNREEIREGKWRTEYFKGIASNSHEEIKEYFEHLEDHIRHFVWYGVIDANYIERAFSTRSRNDRKKWILEHVDGLYDTSPSSSEISYHEFIEKELVLYFHDNVKRTIPSIMDGFKISQRKIMFTLLETDAFLEKGYVSSLAVVVSRSTAYHHRLASLASAIISMAQDFCGTNNLNLLIPHGTFGTRYSGRQVHDNAPTYLKVEISPIAKLIFPKEDYDLIDRDREDGKEVQPKWYAPIFPLILVNGAIGIGCGFKTSVLNYDVNTIIRNLESLMDNTPTEEMIPSYRGFKGTVAKAKRRNSYTITGKWFLDETGTRLTIIEIPVGVWYMTLEKRLNVMKQNTEIKDFEIIKKGPDGEAVHWYKILLPDALDEKTIVSRFQLKKTMSSDIYLYNAQGCLRYYTSPLKVLHDFYIERLKIYEKRKDRLIKEGSIPACATAEDLWKNDLEKFKKEYNR